MKRNKTITEKDIYYFYPYKKNPINSIGVPQPYVKKQDISDHQYSLTYDNWLDIVKEYLTLVREELYAGKSYRFPKLLGAVQFKKYKVYRRIDWGETIKKQEKVYFKDTDRIIVKWDRSTGNSGFKFKNHWKIRMTFGFRQELAKKIFEDSTYIYNIMDI